MKGNVVSAKKLFGEENLVKSRSDIRLNESEDNIDSIQPPVIFPEKGTAFAFFHKIQKAMSGLPNFIETCKGIMDTVIEEIDAENCSLMLKDPLSGELSIFMARGKKDTQSTHYPGPVGKRGRFKSGEGIAGWVFQEGFSLIVGDTDLEPRFKKGVGLNNNVKSISCFPVREKEEIVGVFNISHSRYKAFGEWERIAMAYVVSQIGAALTSSLFFLQINQVDPFKGSDLNGSIKDQGVQESFPQSGLNQVEQNSSEFVFSSEKMVQIEKIINQVANTNVTVFIQGESGVGKEVVARAIHNKSSRKDKPFIKVNCAALPTELLESELFGYEKGAFTGAYRQKPGKFELADGGTIFLDEIAEIKPSLQAKLLQVLQDSEFSRLGGKKDIKVDVRILSATNKNIQEAIKNGGFREDFYYRLNIVNITIPPLKERKEEIPVLIEHFLKKFAKKFNVTRKIKLSDHALKTLLQYNWPGNIRELENMIQRFIVLGNEGAMIGDLPMSIHPHMAQAAKRPSPFKIWPSLKEVNRQAVQKVESEAIKKVLEQTCWNRRKSAQLLNISYKTLLYKIKECRIKGDSIITDFS
jgi:transcriptional regulator with PAS, ATPase and Fis domain